MAMEVCPTCGTRFTEDSTGEQAQAEFAEAMEWYFNRDDAERSVLMDMTSQDWQDFLEWRSNLDKN